MVAASILLFVFGAALGSFLNVVALRYNPERSVFSTSRIGGRSHCPGCERTLRWFELVPIVSFIIQRARCRNCSSRISFRYLCVELVLGLVVSVVPLALARFYGFIPHPGLLALDVWMWALLALWVLAFLLLSLIVLIDLDKFIIPDELNVAVGAVGVAISVLLTVHVESLPFAVWSFTEHYALLATPVLPVILNRLIGGAIGTAFFWMLYAGSRGRGMGFGDVKLAAAIGLLIGWPDILLGAAFAFIIGGIWGGIVILVGRGRFRDRVPFAPFFVLGTAVAIFFGNAILNGYFSLFST